MRTLILFLLSSLAVGLAAANEAAAPPRMVAIKAGRLIDVREGRVLSDRIILIEDRRITAVGPEAAITYRRARR